MRDLERASKAAWLAFGGRAAVNILSAWHQCTKSIQWINSIDSIDGARIVGPTSALAYIPMHTINHFNLRRFDLNLLLAFDALMQELSVTRAAARLRIRQPAMSHALSNLRTLFDDPLFIRTGHVMEATPRARALHTALHPLLLQMQGTLTARTEFDPATEMRTFRLGINGQAEAIVVPALVAHVGVHAPGIRIQTVPIADQAIGGTLNEDRIDLAIAHVSDDLVWLRRERLYDEQHVCCFNRALLDCSTPITAAQYFGAVHGVVSANVEVSGFLSHLLRHAPMRLQEIHSSHNVMTLLAMTARSPLIATLHGRVAARHAGAFGLTVSPLPFDVGDLEVDMIWHPRSDGDPAVDWLRTLLRSCVS